MNNKKRSSPDNLSPTTVKNVESTVPSIISILNNATVLGLTDEGMRVGMQQSPPFDIMQEYIMPPEMSLEELTESVAFIPLEIFKQMGVM